jgi:hypothetical protein
VAVKMGSSAKKADIVVCDSSEKVKKLIIVEIKSPHKRKIIKKIN